MDSVRVSVCVKQDKLLTHNIIKKLVFTNITIQK